jgi:archaemetzincin
MEKLKILPIGKIPEEILKLIAETLEKTYNLKIEISASIDILKESYNPSRNQYLAEKILDFIKKKFSGKNFGVANVDIYAEGLNFIFGQAELNGSVGMVSIYRLNPKFYGLPFDKKIFFERIEKEAIHEVGHMLGLTHCKNESCVMSFSNSIFEVDRKSKDLCEKCKKLILNTGNK